MKVLRSKGSLRELRRRYEASRESVGFVPTMGYLHEGHLSLVRMARRENDRVVASLFVNPLQFGPGEDFKAYPRDMKRDLSMLRRSGVDAVYVPSGPDMYPSDFQTSVAVAKLSKGLCGRSRPTHFAGVATVVTKLLTRVRPDRVYLGQKDYQQVKVIERLILDLDLEARVRMGAIVREKDGLAMSSRNVYLDPSQRSAAPGIRRALLSVADLCRRGERGVPRLRAELGRRLRSIPGARVDYAEIVNAEDLQPVLELRPGRKVLAAAAVYFGRTRLIDNQLMRGV